MVILLFKNGFFLLKMFWKIMEERCNFCFSDVVPPKKAKNNTSLLHKWEFEQQTGKWVEIKTAALSQLEKALQENLNKVSINLGKNIHALVDLEQMKFTEKDSKEERNLRYCILDQQAWMVWCLEDMHKNSINYFSFQISKQLESANLEKNKQEVCFKLKRRNYQVDLFTMKMINSKKKEVAFVKRINIDDEDTKEKKLHTPNGKSKDDNQTEQETGGDAVVDPICVAKVQTAHVLKEGNVVWDAMLNQTNIQFNNNKFYKLQILEDNDNKNYSLWFHWGRVGKSGQNKLTSCGNNLDKAKQMFTHKFFDKTKNSWDDRNSFEKVDGKYDLVIIDYSVEKKRSNRKKELAPPPDSKLSKQIQDLMNLVFNVKAMENAVKEMQYDINKAPLGNLTNKQVAAGYEALTEISKLLKNKQTDRKALLHECNTFYTRIPHYFGGETFSNKTANTSDEARSDVGARGFWITAPILLRIKEYNTYRMRTPPLIQTMNELQQKIQLMDMLGDIREAMKIVDEEVIENVNPIDSHYESLHCEIEVLSSSNPDYQIIKDFLMNSHAKLHQRYSMELLEIFVCKKENEHTRFNHVGNKMLLWHGSRVTNYGGILSQGLRIAPPEAPVTGYMFGKGIYFADMSSKSANYCYTSKKNDIGFLLLSEVALGNQEKLINATDADFKLPSGKHSVMGLGQYAPDPATFSKLSDGTDVPTGVETETNISNPNGYTLRYNEYIVYNSNQVKMRYLLKVKFVYDSFI
ncbi:Poly [ADP-ribose] polymerase 2 [Nymphon striatum]|nr:Poly [ADP-ribose] polymerase 2 [Nymphon striatum]